MVEKQNITLSLPKHILRKAKIIAIEHHTSLSGLMVDLLTRLVEDEDQYTRARRRHLAWLAQGADLGTNGKMSWSRESLHER